MNNLILTILSSTFSRTKTIKPYILLFGILSIITGQIYTTEVNAAKRSEVTCKVTGETDQGIKRTCCEIEVDTETGERTDLGCWKELCFIIDGVETDCWTQDVPFFDPSNRPLGEQQEVQPVLPSSENGITDNTPDQDAIVQSPSNDGVSKGDNINQINPNQQDTLVGQIGSTDESDSSSSNSNMNRNEVFSISPSMDSNIPKNDIDQTNNEGNQSDTSTERGGNPLEGLNLSKSKLLAQCLALKQETKGHEIGGPAEPKTLEEKCKEIGA